MTRRSRRRPVILVILASVVGALLAFIPRPSLSVVREMRAHTDTPLVSSASAPAAGLVAHKEGVAEFRMIGVTWTGTAQPDLKVRTLSHGTWSAWSDLGPTDNAPDPGTREASHAANSSEPFWVGKADGYQVQVPDGVTGVRVHLVRDTGPKIQLHASAPAAEASAPMPPIGSRASWGARAPKQAPEYASTVSVAFVHHTVNSNSYAPGDVPAILRAIQAYHMDTNGWNDIGYNFLVDRYGGIWEGRAGGIDRPVIGAQILGFNTNSTGVAVIGDFGSAAPTGSSLDATGRLLAWKLSLTGVDPQGTNVLTSSDSGSRFPAGTAVRFNNISGHRDGDYTDCPGNYLYNALPQIRNVAKAWWGAFLVFPAGFGGGVYTAAGDFTGDGKSEVVAGAGSGGGPAVEIFRTNGSNMGGFYAFPVGFGGGVRVAAGAVDNAGGEDVVAGAGPGGGPAVEVFRADGSNWGGFYAYAQNFVGGVYVAAGRVSTAVPHDAIVTGAGAGGGPHVRVFTQNGTALAGFMAYSSSFSGGVRVAVGDVNGDGVDEIITAAGPGGGPHVRVFRLDGTPIAGFMAYSPSFTGGVYVGTVRSSDGKRDWIVTGAGEGGGSHVRILDMNGNQQAGFFASSPDDTHGIRVAGGAFAGSPPGQIVFTEGPGSVPMVGFRRVDGSAFFPS